MTSEMAASAGRGSLAEPLRRLGERPAGERRPPLEVVRPAQKARRRRRSRPVALFVALAMVVTSMLAVVIGHAMLAQTQVRLSSAQSALSVEQARNRQEQLATAALEMPSRIVDQAEQQLHMVQPQQVTQVPYTPLGAPEQTPSVAGAQHGGSTSGSSSSSSSGK